MQTDRQLSLSRAAKGTYLPIRIESVIPHDIAGTDAPLYNALGPFSISSVPHEAALVVLLPQSLLSR